MTLTLQLCSSQFILSSYRWLRLLHLNGRADLPNTSPSGSSNERIQQLLEASYLMYTQYYPTDAIAILRCAYLIAAAAIVLVAISPPLRDRFLSYGARTSETPLSSAEKEKQALQSKQKKPSRTILTSLLDELQQWQVPHDWFWTFYALSVTLSAFWPGEAMFLHGPVYGLIRDSAGPLATSMTFEQLKVTWVMLLVQGGRRLYESLIFVEWEEFGTDKIMSKMWGGHWAMGLAFYIATSVAFWIEGIRKHINPRS